MSGPVKMADRLELWPVEGLVPYAKNSRVHTDDQVQQIAASITEFGFTAPVLIDGSNGIIAGHGRVMAAKLIGMDRVPVIQLAHLTDAQKRAYIIADNKLTDNSTFDLGLLSEELADLQADGFDLALTGFSDDELAELLEDDEEEGGAGGDEDAVGGTPEQPVSVPGDIWLLGKHRLMCGDSTSIDAVEKVMAGGKADMIFTDPPYGVDYEGINNDSRDGLADLLDQVFSNYVIAARPGAPIYVFHSDRCADIFHTAFRSYFHFSSMVIWVKPSLVLSQTDYQSRHEPCLYGWTEGAAHAWHSDRKQTSVWEFGKESVAGHTTPKPVAMVSYAIENSSKNGAVVADFFGGSGSTLMGCEQTARQARLIEIDPRYCDVIVKRWEKFTGKQAQLEDTGESFADVADGRGVDIAEPAEA